jgi:DNA gyrase subunit B
VYGGWHRVLCALLNENKKTILAEAIYLGGERDGIEFETAIQYNEGFQETILSFANNINTIEGGTHLSGFKSSLTRAVNAYIKNENMMKNDKVRSAGFRHPRGHCGGSVR